MTSAASLEWRRGPGRPPHHRLRRAPGRPTRPLRLCGARARCAPLRRSLHLLQWLQRRFLREPATVAAVLAAGGDAPGSAPPALHRGEMLVPAQPESERGEGRGGKFAIKTSGNVAVTLIASQQRKTQKVNLSAPYRFARLCQKSGTGRVAVGGRLHQGTGALLVGDEHGGAVLQEEADPL